MVERSTLTKHALASRAIHSIGKEQKASGSVKNKLAFYGPGNVVVSCATMSLSYVPTICSRRTGIYQDQKR